MMDGRKIPPMSSETDALLRQIRRWLLVVAFLLGVGTLTLAHTGYILTATDILYWQSLVFSVASVIGGGVALVAGLKILGSFPSTESERHSTE